MKNAFAISFTLLVVLFAPGCETKFPNGRAHSKSAAFSTRVVDPFGRPLADAQVDLEWWREEPGREVVSVPLAAIRTDTNGVAQATYDASGVPKDQSVWIRVSKTGYSGYSTSGNRREFVLERTFQIGDLNDFALLPILDRTPALREILGSDASWNDLQKPIFQKESLFREPLRQLVSDRFVFQKAFAILAFIGDPADLRLILKNAPEAKRKLFEDRWAYSVVSAIAEPSTDAEWKFLQDAVLNKYNDLWFLAGAIRSLKIIATPKAEELLTLASRQPYDRYRISSITNAIEYVRSAPEPLTSDNLLQLAERIAQIIKIGEWRGNAPPVFNEARTKAFVDISYRAGRDALTYTATLHKEGDVWKFRGVRETMQALMARSSE